MKGLSAFTVGVAVDAAAAVEVTVKVAGGQSSERLEPGSVWRGAPRSCPETLWNDSKKRKDWECARLNAE
jgi:hypothetical protein